MIPLIINELCIIMVMDDAAMLFLVVQPSDYSVYILYSPPLILCTLHFDTDFIAYSNSNLILLCILFLIQYICYHLHSRLC